MNGLACMIKKKILYNIFPYKNEYQQNIMSYLIEEIIRKK